MTLPVKTFAQFVSDMVTAWSNAVGLVPALQAGDALYATFQSVAAQAIFLQALAQILNAVARAQTSTGADLDSFMAQFGFTRLPATYNTGPAVFGKYAPAAVQYLVPVGTVIQTPGGAAQYAVVADPTQPTWSASLNAYVMAAGQTSLTATVEATVAGTGPNVAAGMLTQIASPLPGIDTVNNLAPINNGVNAETDTAFRARFVLYVNSLAKATQAAILSAIANVQQGIFVNLLENETPSGSTRYGEFTAVIDDGSGDPPASLITNVFNAVEAVRGFTIMPQVVAVTTVAPTIALNIRVATGYTASTVQTAVQDAVVAAVNTIEVSEPTLFISFIENAALAVPGCAGVQPGQTKINGSNADLSLTAFQEPRITTTNVSVGTY
jgi:uncharacterized phage protein gp47/JayE